MSARQFLAIFLICTFAAFCGAYLGVRALPLRANADAAVGNGSASSGVTTGGSSQTGTDPGGGLCVSGNNVSLCNPITATITSSASTPFALTNTTGPTIITSAATTGTAFQFNNSGSTTGHLIDVAKAGAACSFFDNLGSLNFSAN